ncbi:hypothetical protein LCGC14_3011040, partial [marine sediment metagenome]
MLRVRQLIEPLVPSTAQLLEDNLLPPNIELLFNSSKTVRYPPFVYTLQKKHKWAFSHFGIFIEDLLRGMLAEDWKDKLYELYLETTKHYTHHDISKLVSKKDLYSAMGRFVNISKYIAEEFTGKKLLYNQEYKHDVITGHPDIVTANVSEVYDVKTTTKFNSPTMKNNTILQLSAYLALTRAAGYNPTLIGVVLPFQQLTLTYDLEYAEYDHKPFLKLLLEIARPRIYSLTDKLELATFLPIIGAHTKKAAGSVYKSLLNFYKEGVFTRPCQIFMRGNRGAKSVKLPDSDIAE